MYDFYSRKIAEMWLPREGEIDEVTRAKSRIVLIRIYVGRIRIRKLSNILNS